MSRIMKRISFTPNGATCGIRVGLDDSIMLMEVCSKKLKAFCDDGPYSITEFMDTNAKVKIVKKPNGILFETKDKSTLFESKNLKDILSSVSKDLS